MFYCVKYQKSWCGWMVGLHWHVKKENANFLTPPSLPENTQKPNWWSLQWNLSFVLIPLQDTQIYFTKNIFLSHFRQKKGVCFKQAPVGRLLLLEDLYFLHFCICIWVCRVSVTATSSGSPPSPWGSLHLKWVGPVSTCCTRCRLLIGKIPCHLRRVSLGRFPNPLAFPKVRRGPCLGIIKG